MRVNVYAEEMTDRVEIIKKNVGGHDFTAVRFYLELPASFVPDPVIGDGALRPASIKDTVQADQMKAPFIHHPGDDDSSAVTFWGKRDLRPMLRKALALLDEHYAERDVAGANRTATEVLQDREPTGAGKGAI